MLENGQVNGLEVGDDQHEFQRIEVDQAAHLRDLIVDIADISEIAPEAV